MPDENFSTEVLTGEVVVGHSGTITLHGSLIEPNPKAKREARRYLTEAYNAAKGAVRHSAG